MADLPSPRPSALVVGIGASAGGLAAFKRFLASTPADTGMAFVLVQHLDPHHKSLLVELLGAHSPIPVVTAKDGLVVKENCVFVIPPDATLTIEDGFLRLTTPAPAREHRRPIDTFFTSLAEDYGERAIGIVLAGVGSDGAIGIRTIKEHGGLTLAQAEVDATAMLGMPSSAVATGLVDHVVPVEAMSSKLTDYHRHLIKVAEKKDGDGHRRDLHEHLEKITSLLHARSEHDFSGYKEATLMRRVQRRMQVLHIDSAAGYLERLQTDKGEIEALFRELLIGVTQFFRDPQAFEALKTRAVVPLLSAKGEGELIRIWVPGCSTGEEAYSMAILLRETLEERHAGREVTIFGTDIDANAVAIARAGRYRKETSGVSPERLERWFVRAGDDYCLVAEIRNMCVFSTHSLVRDPPFSKLDLISCRNVLIYFEGELQDRLTRTFHYALLPDGYLFLGTTEGVTRNSRLFTALDKKNRILQRRDAGGALPAFQPQGIAALQLPLPGRGARGLHSQTACARQCQRPVDRGTLERRVATGRDRARNGELRFPRLDRGATDTADRQRNAGLCPRHPRARHQRRQVRCAVYLRRTGCDPLVGRGARREPKIFVQLARKWRPAGNTARAQRFRHHAADKRPRRHDAAPGVRTARPAFHSRRSPIRCRGKSGGNISSQPGVSQRWGMRLRHVCSTRRVRKQTCSP